MKKYNYNVSPYVHPVGGGRMLVNIEYNDIYPSDRIEKINSTMYVYSYTEQVAAPIYYAPKCKVVSNVPSGNTYANMTYTFSMPTGIHLGFNNLILNIPEYHPINNKYATYNVYNANPNNGTVGTLLDSGRVCPYILINHVVYSTTRLSDNLVLLKIRGLFDHTYVRFLYASLNESGSIDISEVEDHEIPKVLNREEHFKKVDSSTFYIWSDSGNEGKFGHYTPNNPTYFTDTFYNIDTAPDFVSRNRGISFIDNTLCLYDTTDMNNLVMLSSYTITGAPYHIYSRPYPTWPYVDIRLPRILKYNMFNDVHGVMILYLRNVAVLNNERWATYTAHIDLSNDVVRVGKLTHIWDWVAISDNYNQCTFLTENRFVFAINGEVWWPGYGQPGLHMDIIDRARTDALPFNKWNDVSINQWNDASINAWNSY